MLSFAPPPWNCLRGLVLDVGAGAGDEDDDDQEEEEVEDEEEDDDGGEASTSTTPVLISPSRPSATAYSCGRG